MKTKKILILLTCLALMLSFTGCGKLFEKPYGTEESEENNDYIAEETEEEREEKKKEAEKKEKTSQRSRKSGNRIYRSLDGRRL